MNPTLSVNTWKITVTSFLSSNEVGAEAENTGYAEVFWNAGANHLLGLTFIFFCLRVSFMNCSAAAELKKVFCGHLRSQ